MKTQIIYEDQHLLVCYKPAGIAVQTASIGQQDMVSELKNYLTQSILASGNKSAGPAKEPYVGVIHRLDQPVSGVLVFAKNQSVAAKLSAQIQNESAGKIYRAYVYGTFEEKDKEGILENILVKDARTNTSRVVSHDSKESSQGKKAKLSYKVLQEIAVGEEMYSEVEIRLYTGRHHQIRVQMSNAGHPILGDAKYGTTASAELTNRVCEQIGKGLKLCAYQLSFKHPATQKEVIYTAPECFG